MIKNGKAQGRHTVAGECQVHSKGLSFWKRGIRSSVERYPTVRSIIQTSLLVNATQPACVPTQSGCSTRSCVMQHFKLVNSGNVYQPGIKEEWSQGSRDLWIKESETVNVGPRSAQLVWCQSGKHIEVKGGAFYSDTDFMMDTHWLLLFCYYQFYRSESASRSKCYQFLKIKGC